MDERPAQPPEGRLLAAALERSGLSIRQASKRAGISYGRWRQIVSGYQNVSPGSYGRVTGPARTVARMAAVVGVTPRQMKDAGRGDAAEILERILSEATPSAPHNLDPAERAIAEAAGLTEQDKAALITLLRAGRRAAAERDDRTGTC